MTKDWAGRRLEAYCLASFQVFSKVLMTTEVIRV